MNYIIKKKTMFVPIISIILLSVLAISISAGAYCMICHNESSVSCTGQDTSRSITHYEFQLGFIHWGESCTYTTPTHWVATTCHTSDVGNHVYDDYWHPAGWCGQYESKFPCSDVSNW